MFSLTEVLSQLSGGLRAGELRAGELSKNLCQALSLECVLPLSGVRLSRAFRSSTSDASFEVEVGG